MFKNLSIPFALFLSVIGTADAEGDLSAVLMGQSEGCMTGPMAQFGRYIGDWDIVDQGLQPDGKTWKPGNGARWNFTCVGDGIAVQDFWMPNRAEDSPPPGVGTNLRIYDPKTEQWDIAWTATSTPGLAHIRAKQNQDGNIIMHWVSPEQTPPRRITFFEPCGDSWDWLLEMSFDEGESWRAVYKIKASLKK